MRKKIRMFAAFLMGAVFIGSCGMLLRQAVDYYSGQIAYEQAAQLVSLPEQAQPVPMSPAPFDVPLTPEDLLPEEPASVPAETPAASDVPAAQEDVWVDPYADALRNMDFSALRQVNGDVLGWILIPDTNLSYPLLQGEDNDYYLNHTWRKGRNSVGSIFLDFRCSGDFSDFHSIIYGHRMNDRSMFGQLHRYKNQSYLDQHPKIYITDDNGSRTYTVFSAYETDSMISYSLAFSGNDEKQAFLDYALAQSCVDAGVIPDTDGNIVTLSTCTGNGHDTRWVVHALLTE